mmetsp:Transcript_13115/g.52871  ORF Transcript_13115/g.52871 Transcript_13115/m.52871 type:complete len:420 (+) Transcript_13115:505-1764(+)
MTLQTTLTLCSLAAFLGPVAMGDTGSIHPEVDTSRARHLESNVASELSHATLQNAEHEGANCESQYFCIAHLDKVFTRIPTVTLDDQWDKADSQAWLESNQQSSKIWYAHDRINEAFSAFHLYDLNRGMKIFFDARDEHAVLSYWCSISKCVWNILAIDGKLRHGEPHVCAKLRAFTLERLLLQVSTRALEPELRTGPTTGTGGIAIVTASTPNLVNSSAISADLNIKYAERHGYAFYQYRDTMVPKHIITWNKVRVLMDILTATRHEWIMWIDADAVVTNRNISIEGIIKATESSKIEQQSEDDSIDLIVCNDIGGWPINTGVMLWRNTDWARNLLNKLWATEHIPHMRGAEQAQLIKLLRREDPLQKRHVILDQTAFNAHPSVHRDEFFIIHMMGFSEAERAEKFKHYQLKLARPMK